MYTGETTLGGIENPFPGRVLGRNHVVGGRAVPTRLSAGPLTHFFQASAFPSCALVLMLAAG